MTRRQAGFTLIEAMIVLSIISILAVIALPVYSTYKTRAAISEGLSLIGPIKYAIAEHFYTSSQWPDSNAAAGIDAASNYQTKHVESITIVSDGVIVIDFAIPRLGANDTLEYKPLDLNGRVGWNCTGGALANRVRPAECQF